MWQSIDLSAVPTPPQSPPTNPDASDLSTIAGLVADWSNYAIAWQQISAALSSDPNFIQWQNFMQLSSLLGTDKNGYHGFEYAAGTQSYSAASNANWGQGQQYLTTQLGLINAANNQVNAAKQNVTDLQNMYTKFSNTGAGSQEENTVLQNAKTGTVKAQTALTSQAGTLAQQQAAAAAANAATQTKKIIIISVVGVVIVVILVVLYHVLKKKA